jgi:hypothetical protein
MLTWCVSIEHIYRYVAQFSRSLYVEYRGKGIDVQCHVCNVVLTNSRLLAVYSEFLLITGPLNLDMCLQKRFLPNFIHGATVMPRTVACIATVVASGVQNHSAICGTVLLLKE